MNHVLCILNCANKTYWTIICKPRGYLHLARITRWVKYKPFNTDTAVFQLTVYYRTSLSLHSATLDIIRCSVGGTGHRAVVGRSEWHRNRSKDHDTRATCWPQQRQKIYRTNNVMPTSNLFDLAPLWLKQMFTSTFVCLLYTSDAADE